MYLSFAILTALPTASIGLSVLLSTRDPKGTLILLDGGRGHASGLGTRWPTSLRNISTVGTSASVLHQFSTTDLDYIAHGYGLAYDSKRHHLYAETQRYGLVRADRDGTNVVPIPNETGPKSTNWFTGLTIQGSKIYWSDGHHGLIKRANLDGSGTEVVRNTSQGIGLYYDPSSADELTYMYAAGVAVDENEEYVYWSTTNHAKSNLIPHGASIRRAPIVSNVSLSEGGNANDVESPVQDIQAVGQVRLLEGGKSLYWVEPSGRSSLKRLVIPSEVSEPGSVPTEVVTKWEAYGINNFDVDEESGKVWLASGDDYWGRGYLFETDLRGREVRLLNNNTEETGAPTGVVYVGR